MSIEQRQRKRERKNEIGCDVKPKPKMIEFDALLVSSVSMIIG